MSASCRRPSPLLWRQLGSSSRASFRTLGAAAAKRTARVSKPTPKSTPRPPLRPQPISRPPPPSQPKSQPSQSGKKLINAPLAGALALAVVLGFYATTALLPSSSSSSSPGSETPTDPLYSGGGGATTNSCHTPTGRPTSLSGLSAADFDRELDREESRTGVTALRERLAGRAAGHVLEVAVGTGRNFAHYPWGDLVAPTDDEVVTTTAAVADGAESPPPVPRRMLSFTGVDIASDMLEVAASKLKAAAPPLKAAEPEVEVLRDGEGAVAAGAVSFLGGAVRMVKADALSYLPPPPTSTTTTTTSVPDSASPTPTSPPPTTYYDTVIQTFGLCSVSDPTAALSRLAPLVRPGTGRVFLLEHGRGTWRLVNWWLDRHAPAHFSRYGCWWNRDLEAVVRDACERGVVAGAGGGGAARRVEVVKVERPGWQGGTVLWIELKVVEEGA